MTIRNLARSTRFVVSSRRINPQPAKVHIDYDYCGSIASALRAIDERGSTGAYKEVVLHRGMVTKGRKRGSRRFLYASNPITALKLVEEIRL